MKAYLCYFSSLILIFLKSGKWRRSIAFPPFLTGICTSRSENILPSEEMCRNSLAVQWLGLRVSTAGGTGSIPGWIPQAVWCVPPQKSRKVHKNSISDISIKVRSAWIWIHFAFSDEFTFQSSFWNIMTYVH